MRRIFFSTLVGILCVMSLWGCGAPLTQVPEARELQSNSEPIQFSAGTESGKTEITFLGRASLKIKTSEGIVIYIDPFGGKKTDYEEPADLILVTHQHSDHNKISWVTQQEDVEILNCPKSMQEGDLVLHKNIKIEAVAAYNGNHKRENGCGYLLTINGTVLYHSGDTSKIEEMTSLSKRGIDYAFLCADGYYNMGPQEAMEVAEMIQAKRVIPIHTSAEGLYDEANDSAFDLENTLHMAPGDMIIVKPEQKNKIN